ncbi:hypothetical protein EBU71_15175 [bacterium]|jgi:hypothetical protein|nr:hypothetical protein [Candidatus Elulimicrobium humile]
MEDNTQKSISKEQIKSSIEAKLNNVYFDVQGLNVSKITEHNIARLITKVAVGAVTVWWSLLELRSIYNTRKTIKG